MPEDSARTLCWCIVLQLARHQVIRAEGCWNWNIKELRDWLSREKWWMLLLSVIFHISLINFWDRISCELPDPSGLSLFFKLEAGSDMRKARRWDSRLCTHLQHAVPLPEHVPGEERRPRQVHAHPYRHRGCAGPGKCVQSYLTRILFLPFREIAGGCVERVLFSPAGVLGALPQGSVLSPFLVTTPHSFNEGL